MNFKEFYKEVSQKSGYDEDLVRIVYNNFWHSVRDNTKNTVIFDFDHFGLMHVAPKVLQRYMKRYTINAKPEYIEMFEQVKKDKLLKKLMYQDEQSDNE
jgi:hypothetical protein